MSDTLDIQVLAAAAIKPDDFEPLVRKLADSLYEKLLDDVQDYMIDNVQFNIGSMIDSLTYERDQARKRHAKLYDALRTISEASIPDQPETAPGDELAWAQRHVASLRRIAFTAIEQVSA